MHANAQRHIDVDWHRDVLLAACTMQVGLEVCVRKYISFDVEGEGTCHVVFGLRGLFILICSQSGELTRNQPSFLGNAQIFQAFSATVVSAIWALWRSGQPNGASSQGQRKHVLRWGEALHILPFWSSCQSANGLGVP